jgi:tRNA threonylcarbamoyladenosine biosynthesis protein TsaE
MENYFLSVNPAQTEKSGRNLGRFLCPGDNITLTGELGSGKTLFTKGIAHGLGIEHPEYVNSPSFVIAKEYNGKIKLYHLDLYRLDDLRDIEYLGIREYLNGDGVVVIEWAERMENTLPAEYLNIHIEITGIKKRRFWCRPHGKRYDRIVSRYLVRQV